MYHVKQLLLPVLALGLSLVQRSKALLESCRHPPAEVREQGFCYRSVCGAKIK